MIRHRYMVSFCSKSYNGDIHEMMVDDVAIMETTDPADLTRLRKDCVEYIYKNFRYNKDDVSAPEVFYILSKI